MANGPILFIEKKFINKLFDIVYIVYSAKIINMIEF
jgi:hypothetical protein